MKIKATTKKNEIIHVEMVDEKNTEAMLAIARDKDGRVQYQCHGTGPALLALADVAVAQTVKTATDALPMPDEVKVEMIEKVLCKHATEILEEMLAKDKKEAEDDDDDMPKDMKEALRTLEKIIDKLGDL